jgi:O-antigen/teichoic acid export membrane protein
MGKYIKIYFWQFISILFNFASVFVVTPFISSNQTLYGIYSIVMSAYLFISYADFGFLGAGMKYASESFAQKNIKDEVEVLGFAGMVFLVFIGLYSLTMIYFSFCPDILVKGLKNDEELLIARHLLLILAFFSPVLVFQRIIQIIFGVRLLDYKFQRILIGANLVKVVSAFFFFLDGNYRIVEYFLFSQICNLSAVLIGFYLLNTNLQYDVRLLFNSFKLSSRLFKKTKKLAFTSIFLTLSWILYYELDPFVIGKFLGVNQVAIYAIGLTIITYFRSMFGIFFTPFIAKFNHFIGLNDKEGLQKFLFKVIVIFLPLTVFPVVAVFLTTQNFIYNWVGSSYSNSVVIAQILVSVYVFSFISYPAGILIMANERVKFLYITAIIQPFVYWMGIWITFKYLGLESFAFFKVIAFFINIVVYTIVILKFLEIDFSTFVSKIIFPAILPISVIIISLLLIRGHLTLEFNKIYLIYYFLIIGCVILVGIFCYYFTSIIFRQFANQLFSEMRNKLNNSKLMKTM